MKLPIITDLHWGFKNDNALFKEYFNRFFTGQFLPYVDKHKIKDIVHCGDLMDRRKYVNIDTLRFVREKFIEPMEARGITMHTFVGNHDVYFRNTNSVNSTQELFGRSPAIKIYDTFQDVSINGVSYAMIPWVTDDNVRQFEEFLVQTTSKVAFAHLELAGFEVLRGVIADHGMDMSLFRKFDSVYSGHYHQKSNNGNIWYLGTAYDMTFADLNEAKGFHVLDQKKDTLQFVQNPEKMFFKIIYDDTDKVPKIPVDIYKDRYVKVYVRSKKSAVAYDKFLTSLYEVCPAEVDIVEEVELLPENTENIDETMDTLHVIFEQIDGNPDIPNGNKLKQLMAELYTLSMESD